MIPFGDLGRTYRRLQGEIDAAVGSVLGGGWFILGACLAEFERDFARLCEVDHAIGVGNGTDAIALALRAVGVGPGDEVITAPLSAAFSALAISQIGAIPVFADIDPAYFTLDPARIEAAITPRTRAILPVHLYGQPADMDAILAIARLRGLAVVEDAAQAHGARYRGHRVGSLADAAAFSFYPSKNLGAFGDGGMVTTDEPAIAHRVRLLRNGGQSTRYRHEILGVNSRLDELQAAILGVRLRHLDADNDRRRAIAARYTAALTGVAGIVPPAVASQVEPVFHLYVVRAVDRATVAARLDAAGIETAVHYPTPTHRQPAYAELVTGGAGGGRPAADCPEADRAAREVLSIPIYPELTDAEVDGIAAALAGLREIV
jgi:dTDP-3-amino-3,4,6-trideoxy-alpha-D-glucose transaminase